jgi:transposase-like protein
VDFVAKVCDVCGMQFKDNAELGVHMRQNHQKFYCGVCRKEFDNEVELKNHVKTIHGLASNALA